MVGGGQFRNALESSLNKQQEEEKEKAGQPSRSKYSTPGSKNERKTPGGRVGFGKPVRISLSLLQPL